MSQNPALPPRFRPFRIPTKAPAAYARERRPSPRERGYDARWDRLSVAFRKRNPYCAECARRGRDTIAACVDHKLPATDYPELKYSTDNLQALCTDCHDGWKQRMEVYARRHGLLDMLAEWCDDIMLRPIKFRPIMVSR